MIILKLILVIVVFVLSTFLFYKASGSLKIRDLNMISMIYYYMVVFNYIGGALIFLGLRNHYLIVKIRHEETFNTTFLAISFCMIVLPLTLLAVKAFMKKYVVKRDTLSFLAAETTSDINMVPAQITSICFLALCAVSTLYVFRSLGYIPFLEMARGTNLEYLRQLGSRFFEGNQYIKNLFMTTLTPFISYYVYINFRTTKDKTWGILFALSAALSLVVLTYDFSKSPVVTYLLGLYLIEVALGNIKNNKKFVVLMMTSAGIIVFFYAVVFGAGKDILSIYTGPVGRIIFTQIATLFLHFEAFPYYHEFLGGGSFNSWMSIIIPNAEGLRSGRVVMEIFNARAVREGTAGVMNTLFIGEAYANYGTLGWILAPIIFGVIIGLAAQIVPNFKKNPAIVLIYVKLTLTFLSTVEAGFIDIFYSASTIFVILITIGLYWVSGVKGKKA